jgi:hypothetical protein
MQEKQSDLDMSHNNDHEIATRPVGKKIPAGHRRTLVRAGVAFIPTIGGLLSMQRESASGQRFRRKECDATAVYLVLYR